MDHDIQEAMENINYIKSTIELSKTNYSGLFRLSILFGIYHLLDSLFTFACLYLPQHIDNGIVILLKTLLLILFSGSYLCIYSKEKRHMNPYYLSLIYIWGILGIAVPVVTRTAELISYFLRKETNLGEITGAANVLLFASFLIVSAYVVKNKKIVYMAVVMMFGYILLSGVWWDRGIRIVLYMSSEAVLSYSYLYYLVFVCGGYIFMGLYLRKRVNYDN